MRDYSKYIQSSHGFITKYEIKDGKIYVYTSESKNKEPHIYPANKEWINSIETRLERQYNMLINNKQAIKKDYLKKISNPTRLIFLSLIILFLLLGSIISLSNVTILPFLCSLIPSIFGIFISESIIINKKNKFDEELSLIETYVKNKKDIEKVNVKDQNVTNYLSTRSNKVYIEKTDLKEKGIIDNIFNIDFMDSISLKELKNLLNRYLICKGLKSEQTYVNPSKERIKRRSKVKDTSNEIPSE